MSDYNGMDPAGLARLHRVGGPDFVKKMIDLFLEEAPERLSAARIGEQTGDHAAIAAAAHSLKSSSHNFGAVSLGLIAQRIEMSVRNRDIANLAALLNELEQTFSVAKLWLEDQRKMLPT